MTYELLTEITQTRGKEMKRHGKVEGFHYVQIVSYDGVKTYRAEIPLKLYENSLGKIPLTGYNKCFANARKAAIQIDTEFLNMGKEPPNGLLKKLVK